MKCCKYFSRIKTEHFQHKVFNSVNIWKIIHNFRYRYKNIHIQHKIENKNSSVVSTFRFFAIKYISCMVRNWHSIKLCKTIS